MALETSTIALGPSVLLNHVDADGTKWLVSQNGFQGWGSPASNIEVVGKPRERGAWAGDSFDSERVMSINGTITAQTPQLLNTAIDALKGAVTNEPFLMQVTESGQTRWVMARKMGETLTPKITNLIGTYSVQVVALDPRQFGVELTGSTSLPSFSGGLTVPFTVPFSINADLVSGQVNLINPGNETGPVLLRIDGPCHGPSVSHAGSGLALTFSSSLVLGSGEWLDVDMEAQTVLANGQASRNGFVTARGWSGFTPGLNSWSFTASSFDAGALLTVSATPAWK